MKNSRFRMLAYSGQPIKNSYWDKVTIDTNGIRVNAKLPVLREHARDRIVGIIDAVTTAGGKLHAEGCFVASQEGQEVKALAKEGFPWEASIGVWAEKVQEVRKGQGVLVNGSLFEGPGCVWTKSHLREISFVVLGADDKTSVAIAASQQEERRNDMRLNNGPTFETLVAEHQKKTGCSRADAIREVAVKHPRAHARYIQSVNPTVRVKYEGDRDA